MVMAMPWVDQKDVASQHLALADEALARAAADPAVSCDVIETLTQLRASTVALAKIAGVAVYEAGPTAEGERPTTR